MNIIAKDAEDENLREMVIYQDATKKLILSNTIRFILIRSKS